MSLATQIVSLASRVATEFKAVRSELASGLAGKASTSHTHAISSLSDASITSPSNGQALVYNGSAWANAAVTASVADGSITDAKITSGGLSPSKITGTAVITTDSRLSDARTPTAHSHAQSDITGLSTALAGKASTSHTHTKTDITDFAHSHAISEVTNLQSSLDAKAAATHSHAQSDITGLSTALSGKVDNSSGTSFPVSPTTGQVFVNTTTKCSYIYTGAAWDELSRPNPIEPLLLIGI